MIRIFAFLFRMLPEVRGKGRLVLAASLVLSKYQGVHEISLKNQRSQKSAKILLRFPDDIAYAELLLTGRIERGTMLFLEEFLRGDDVVFDVGANIGYVSIIAGLSTYDGAVYSFEPMPSTYARLLHNLRLNAELNHVHPTNTAIVDRNGEIVLRSFTDLHHGFSSIATFGRHDAVDHRVPASTLDSYCAVHGIEKVDFIKIDVEGAEKKVLDGGKSVIKRMSPSLLVEMNADTASANGFTCDQLLNTLAQIHEYAFYRFPKAHGTIRWMKSTSDFQSGDNVAAISPRHRDRLRSGEEKSVFLRR